ncbi:MAG: Uma2 family endonuclease [Verrucomicrobia bacterium]|nr:Uma2 family endonuclease [Verrucomicrobiota bacterium]
MPAILELPEVRHRVSALTVEEYHRLDEFNERGRRTELIRGIVIEKMSKSPLHAAIAKRLYDFLLARLPPGWIVRREDPLTLKDSEPEPDIAVVRGTEAEFFRAHPSTAELVVEVAVSSPELDRENAALYAEAGVKEYWIVLGTTRQIEVYRQPQGGHYRAVQLLALDDSLECGCLPGIRLKLAELLT